jgi:hypothetical protein
MRHFLSTITQRGLVVLSWLAFVFVLTLPGGRQMQRPSNASVDVHSTYPLGTLLDAAPLNGAASTLTFYLGPRARATDYTDSTDATTGPQLRGYKTLLLELKFDYDAQAGTITTTCTGGGTRATATSSLTTCTMSSGTCTLNFSGVAVTSSLSADKNWGFPITISPWPAIKCVVAHGGTPGAADTITVNGWLIAD